MKYPDCIYCNPQEHSSRRDFLRVGSLSLLGVNLAQYLSARETMAATGAGVDKGRAGACILLWLDGGQSQVDTWDYKPELEKQDGKELKGFDKNTGFFTDQVGPLMRSPFKFSRTGKSGTYSSVLPVVAATVATMEACLRRSSQEAISDAYWEGS